jgi:predicted porin
MSALEITASRIKRRGVMIGILLLPAAAFAQSSVTLYGTLDAGMLYTSQSPSPTTGQNAGKQFQFINSGSIASRFGLTGQEDLGGGTLLKFKLESGISLANGGFDNSNGNFFGRQAWGALSTANLGTVTVGLQYTPLFFALLDTDPRGLSQFASALTVYSANTLAGFFVSNAITYTSPTIYGLSGSVMYALGNVAGNFQAGRSYSAALKYEYGGLLVNASIFDSSDGGDKTIDENLFELPAEVRTVGASYRYGKWAVKASYTNYKAPETDLDGLLGGDNNYVWSAGIDYEVTPLVKLTSGVYYIRDKNDSNNHALVSSLGADYSLSRRTSLYAQVGIVNNHGREAQGMSIDGALEGLPGTTVGTDVGIVHRF